MWLLAFCHIPVLMSTYITKEVSLGPCIAPLIRFVKGLPLKSLCVAISPIRHPCTKGGQGTGMGIKAGCPLMWCCPVFRGAGLRTGLGLVQCEWSLTKSSCLKVKMAEAGKRRIAWFNCLMKNKLIIWNFDQAKRADRNILQWVRSLCYTNFFKWRRSIIELRCTAM